MNARSSPNRSRRVGACARTVALALAAPCALVATPALATNGYFPHGYGLKGQGSDTASVELAQFWQFGQQHGHAGCADARVAGQGSGQVGVMALDVGRHLGVAVAQLSLEELDHAFDARAGRCVRDAHALALRGDHLHPLAPSQYQRLQPLQLGIDGQARASRRH